MVSRRFFAFFLACFCCLLPGCAERPISSRLVVSSLGVACGSTPWTAVLEIVREEQNETITVQGEDLTAIFSAAERETGEPLYLGALQSIVFSGVPDADALRDCLRRLLADGRVAPNTQIALCDDALSLYSEEITGDTVTALLTRQYTNSRRNGLKELLNLLEDPGRDGLIPWLSAEEGRLREQGTVATGQSDYTAPWQPEELCRLLLGSISEMRFALPVGQGEAGILLRRLAVSGADFSNRMTGVTLQAEAAVQSVSGSVSREALEAALQNELRQRLSAFTGVMRRTGSDLLGLSARAVLSGHAPRRALPREIQYTLHLVLRDPRGLLR